MYGKSSGEYLIVHLGAGGEENMARCESVRLFLKEPHFLLVTYLMRVVLVSGSLLAIGHQERSYSWDRFAALLVIMEFIFTYLHHLVRILLAV